MEQVKKRVLAICGSTRQNSSNHQLIKAIAAIFKEEIIIDLFPGIAGLPHFNPDDDNGNAPAAIIAFRKSIENAAGIIICTPEYAHGVPGSLKNALDWTVSSSSFSGMPTVLITASTDGKYGHNALLETLNVIEAKDVEELQLLIPFIKTKIKEEKITDADTLDKLTKLIQQFIVKL